MSTIWTEVVKELAQPKVRLTISEWAERYRAIPKGTSPEPGRWRNERVPYLIEPMNAFSDVRVEEVNCMMSSQVGKTEIILNTIGYYASHEPSPILVVQPNQQMMGAFSKERVAPMFRDSPGLRGKLDEGTEGRTSSRKSSNTINVKHFPGGFLAFAGSQATSGLATRPIRIVLLDEVDRYEATKEGDPIKQAVQRAENFYNRKIGAVSTPTIEGESKIEARYNRSDRRLYWVPCVHCGTMQTMVWENVIWDEGRPETAAYMCPHCHGVVRERQRNEMIAQGAWIPQNPESPIRGYHINALYSPWSRFANLAREWVDAVESGDRDLMMAFVNLKLGLPWRNISVRAEESEILGARTELPAQVVPEEADVLAAGIDMQKDGFWFVVRGWAKDFTSWLVHYGFLATWEDLEELLFENEYPIQGSSETKRIWRAALDTGGGAQEMGGVSMTEAAYWWLRKNGKGRGAKVWGVKGSSGRMVEKIRPGQPLDRTPSGKRIPGGLQLVFLDTDELLETFHFRLSRAREGDDPVQGAFLHEEVGEEYAKHIRSHERQTNKKGVEEWVKVGRDDHLLDCELYCHSVVDPQWPGGGLNLLKKGKADQGGGQTAKKKKAKGAQRKPGGQGSSKPSWFHRR